jgi:hypothetical protein
MGLAARRSRRGGTAHRGVRTWRALRRRGGLQAALWRRWLGEVLAPSAFVSAVITSPTKLLHHCAECTGQTVSTEIPCIKVQEDRPFRESSGIARLQKKTPKQLKRLSRARNRTPRRFVPPSTSCLSPAHRPEDQKAGSCDLPATRVRAQNEGRWQVSDDRINRRHPDAS